MPGQGLVPVELMKVGFKLLDPMGSVTKFAAIEQAASDPVRLARTMARERWLEENVPLPAPFAREFIRRTYQEDALLGGTWEGTHRPPADPLSSPCDCREAGLYCPA